MVISCMKIFYYYHYIFIISIITITIIIIFIIIRCSFIISWYLEYSHRKFTMICTKLTTRCVPPAVLNAKEDKRKVDTC